MKLIPSLLVLCCALLTGCATNPAQQQQSQVNDQGDPKDPFETVNRGLWSFNWNVLDRYFLRPAAVGYTKLPKVAQDGLYNAVRNLEEPSNTWNSLLQGKGKKGLNGLSRFAINSTLGVFGLVDVASYMGIYRQVEDLDETLAVWGVGSGPFVMVPVLGPNDTRGLFGDIIDNTSFPYSALSAPLNITRFTLNAIQTRAAFIQTEEQLSQALDDYSFVKTAYFQNKAFTIADGDVDDEALEDAELDDFDEFEAFLEDIPEDDGN